VQARSLIVAFDSPVHSVDLHENSVMVEIQRREPDAICWCGPLEVDIVPGNLDQPCTATSKFTPKGPAPGVDVNAVQIKLGSLSSLLQSRWVRVRVKGDFIRGMHKNGKFLGVDADHLPDWLPGRKTGDGIEGGTFESWFRPPQG
jgi:hypothetical protein